MHIQGVHLQKLNYVLNCSCFKTETGGWPSQDIGRVVWEMKLPVRNKYVSIEGEIRACQSNTNRNVSRGARGHLWDCGRARACLSGSDPNSKFTRVCFVFRAFCWTCASIMLMVGGLSFETISMALKAMHLVGVDGHYGVESHKIYKIQQKAAQLRNCTNDANHGAPLMPSSPSCKLLLQLSPLSPLFHLYTIGIFVNLVHLTGNCDYSYLLVPNPSSSALDLA